MPKHGYHSIGVPWSFDDDLDNAVSTGWVLSGGATQQTGYVEILAQTSITDTMVRTMSSISLPCMIDFVAATNGANHFIRIRNGTNVFSVSLPNTNLVPRLFRLIVRSLSTEVGEMKFYENGVLISERTTNVGGTANINIAYESDQATTGTIMRIYHHQEIFGFHFDAPTYHKKIGRLLPTIFLDGRDGYELLFNRSGIGLPPRSVVSDQIPFEVGEIHRTTITRSRDITLGIKITADTTEELYDKKEQLYLALMDRERVFAIQTATTGQSLDNTFFFVKVRYISGLEGEEVKENFNCFTQLVVVALRALDPAWQREEIRITWSNFTSDAQTAIFTQYLGNSSEHWGELYILGPGNDPAINHQVLGETTFLIKTIASGQYFYINLKPSERTLRFNSVSALDWGALQVSTSQFWHVTAGENRISIQFNAATTDANTKAKLFYRRTMTGV